MKTKKTEIVEDIDSKCIDVLKSNESQIVKIANGQITDHPQTLILIQALALFAIGSMNYPTAKDG